VSFDLAALIDERQGEQFALHRRYLNPQLPRVLATTGFDRTYVRGEGCYLYDDAGLDYLDLLSGFGVFALGRAHPVVKAALADALAADLASMVQLDCSLLAGLLAEELVRRSGPQIERVFFCNSGAEAVEAAIKFARAATKRDRICYFSHAYHGLTMGALSVNGTASFKAPFGSMLPGATEVGFGELEALRAELARGDVAALIVEPIQGKGVFELPPERWREIEAAVHEAGALLICDEVQTGLGRTGRFYAHEHFGLQPDLITVSKALSGGYVPVGAMLASEEIFSAVYSSMDQAMVHSTTFKANPLAMVAGLATLAVFDDEHVIEHAAAMEALWKAKLTSLQRRHELLHEVRGRGQMIGLAFGAPEDRKARRRYDAVERLRPALFSQTLVVPLFQRFRILTQVAADELNVIKLLPPLIAGAAEVDRFCDALDTLLDEAAHSATFYVDFGVQMARGALRPARRAGRQRQGPSSAAAR